MNLEIQQNWFHEFWTYIQIYMNFQSLKLNGIQYEKEKEFQFES
jgi:hypothetical protein